MDCKSASAVVQEYLDGEASDNSIREMQEHLENCPQCREYLASMRTFFDGLDSLDLLQPEPDFAERVMAQVERSSEREAQIEGRNSLSFGWLSVLLAWAKGAAVMAVVVLAFGMLSLFVPGAPTVARVYSTDPAADIRIAGRQVTVPPNVTVHGNLTVVDGHVTIAGTVEGDIRVIRGTAQRETTGKVAGQIVAVESPVAQAKDAVLGAIDWFLSMYNQAVRRMVGP